MAPGCAAAASFFLPARLVTAFGQVVRQLAQLVVLAVGSHHGGPDLMLGTVEASVDVAQSSECVGL